MTAPKAAPMPGDILAGKYRIESLLGTGGMGWVLAARHLELDTRVAVKVLRAEDTASPEHRERFRREARVVAGLQSEHVARVFDFGALDDGSLYVVMELLEGRDIDDEIQARGPLPVAEAVGFCLEACEGIAEAHASGVVHRDIKPKNLFLVRRVDGRRTLKVLDFGIAKKGAAVDEESLTRMNDVLGTPRYMAPEQLRSAKIIDARADIWALGVALYESLTAVPPFDGANEVVIYSAILQQNPPRLHTRRPDVPAELDDIVFRCLEKDPENRFSSVLELAVALEPFAPANAGSSKRIHAILSRDGQRPMPLPLARGSSASLPPPGRLRSGSLTPKKVAAAFRRPIVLAIAIGAAAALVALLILWSALRADEVPPAYAVDPSSGDATPHNSSERAKGR